MAIALALKNVKKVYGIHYPVTALDQINLELEEGSFAALIGPSGSGKSTFLNLAAGLDHPTSGEVCIGNQKISELSKKDLNRFRSFNVGFVFQSYNLLQTLTVIENTELISIIRGDDVKTVRKNALEALASVGLSDKKDFYPQQLSGGQQQRVAIARALVNRPKIIFADEPTANLDTTTAYLLIELFEKLNQNQGVTFLFSTHDARMIERVKKQIILKDGLMTSVGN